jgi:hypothetical protein
LYPGSEECSTKPSSFPVLGLLRPVTDITKQNPSIASEVFPNFFFLLVNIFCVEQRAHFTLVYTMKIQKNQEELEQIGVQQFLIHADADLQKLCWSRTTWRGNHVYIYVSPECRTKS